MGVTLKVTLASFALFAVALAWGAPRTLSFEERVEAQRAIERVHYSHQTGAVLPFEKAVPRALLEAKVKDTLAKSAALERAGAISEEMLQREQERIERDGRYPDRLREIYDALGNDPLRIRECFFRPALVDRLSAQPPLSGASLQDSAPLQIDSVPAPESTCAVDHWEAMSSVNAPPLSSSYGTSRVWTGNLLLVWGADASGNVLGGRYNPLTDSWTPISIVGAPAPRQGPTAVWSGRYMIIWGGNGYLNSGGRYDPIADTWLPTAPAPVGRFLNSAVWTGSQMIVWGGMILNSPFGSNTGGRYDPESDTWTATTTLGAPVVRFAHTAIWTGSRMIVWGGESGTPLATGGSYDPASDQWTPTSTINAPFARLYHSAVWTGSQMIVWGGFNDFNQTYPTAGGRYNPATDTWTATAVGPTGRTAHTAVWDGIQMLVWGGNTFLLPIGSRYDPVTDSWTAITTLNAPLQRSGPVAVWTGSQMLIWGGGSSLTDGGRYFGDTVNLDLDQDGFSACDGDCDDGNAARHPGAVETCDALDEDCDGVAESPAAACDDQDPCTVDECTGANGCSHSSAPDGTACNDDDACTQQDSCLAGVCHGADAVTCSPVDSCHDPGTCDAFTGVCSNPVKPDGSACATPDGCASGQMCFSGVCGGGIPTAPPTISVQLTPNLLQPMNHRMVDIVATVTALDACHAPIGFVLVSITSSEPDDAEGTSDGSTVDDIQGAAPGTSDTAFALRAERDRLGSGRTYIVTYRTTDAGGQVATVSAVVVVPLKHVREFNMPTAGGGVGKQKPRPRD